MVKSISLALIGVSVLAAVSTSARQAAPAAQPAQVAPAAPAETNPNYIVDEAFTQGAVAPGAVGVVPPAMIREVKPSYTPEAMRKKIQGDVIVRTRVGADGTVQDVRVTESLDRGGLDEQAMNAARQHLFRPATLNGAPVITIVDLRLQFRLH